MTFEPTRQAGLTQLEEFAPRAGSQYHAQRNFDIGEAQNSAVSRLSPWIRHRLITEEEVLARTLAHHSPSEAMSFVQEVFWRGYFKGWLEQHPSVWERYQAGLALARLDIGSDYGDAITGRTGIACFDHWCNELVQTGYLHNHARMWFASIWIFTLRLPWELGAEFFLNHLHDGDPASNTLSWRWVGGLHTKGKTYLASASNIARFTNGRFEPLGQLAQTADPLMEEFDHPLVPLKASGLSRPNNALLLITEEDCFPETFIAGGQAGVLGLIQQGTRRADHSFAKRSVEDAVGRTGGMFSIEQDWTAAILRAAQKAGTSHVVTPFAPVGTVATTLASVKIELAEAGIELHQPRRQYDALTWPHATKGFFKLKKKIPEILRNLGLSM